MPDPKNSEPAEGSREVIEKELDRQSQKENEKSGKTGDKQDSKDKR